MEIVSHTFGVRWVSRGKGNTWNKMCINSNGIYWSSVRSCLLVSEILVSVEEKTAVRLKSRCADNLICTSVLFLLLCRCVEDPGGPREALLRCVMICSTGLTGGFCSLCTNIAQILSLWVFTSASAACCQVFHFYGQRSAGLRSQSMSIHPGEVCSWAQSIWN